ncbi:Poly(ribitol-phosphate) beta-glucosyltransferase [Streptomyces sp. enrichment culture]|uniref:glycosyltransferase family 2 protein n=1 Tax=Streptomyces sp. enrichment culture TaxID=1795815 RepID=UPI003F5624BA
MYRQSVPDVTVIIAVYNAMPYLSECLESVMGQTIGAERLEVIAVDDGSTDGSGAELDRYAARHPQFRAVHQPNSGGPGGPRNRALDLARGRYVFFADADDYLGPEALQRLVDMAEAQGSDVVLAKQVGLGRTVSDKAHRHAAEADLYTSEVYRSLHSAKLMRRRVIENERLRYPEDLWYGEDQIFVTSVFLAAARISVVGDYDCYYLRRRDDGQNLTSRTRTAHETVAHIERVMALVADRVTDPVGRRRMLGRHFRSLLRTALAPAAAARRDDPAYTREVYVRARALVEAYWTPDMGGELARIDWIRLYAFVCSPLPVFEQLMDHDPAEEPPPRDLVENGRVYRCLPLFRDPAAGLPDVLYDVTDQVKAQHELSSLAWQGRRLRIAGHAGIPSLGAAGTETEFVLRERETGREFTVPTEPRPVPEAAEEAPQSDGAGFLAEVDLARIAAGEPIPPGTWDCFLNVRAAGVTRTVRLGRRHAPDLDRTARRAKVVARDPGGATELAAAPFYTAYGNLSFEVVRRIPLPTG